MTPGDVYITSRGILWRYMGTDANGWLVFRLRNDGKGRKEKHVLLPWKWKLFESAESLDPEPRVGNHKSPFGIGA